MASMGPVEYVLIAFPGNRFKGEIVPAVAELVDKRHRPHHRRRLHQKGRQREHHHVRVRRAGRRARVRVRRRRRRGGGVLNDEDLQLAAEGLEPDSSAALIVWEHRWAARVAQAIRDAGGRSIAGERIPDEVVEEALADLATGRP
jgi:hypothetical protein